MKQNKKIREELEEKYGKGCMFKKAKIEKKIEEKTTIKTYKKFLQEKKYTGKAIKLYESQMNLHHLQHRSEGGETTVENGAVINSLAHMYIHSLSREQEEFINNELREYKRQADEIKVVFVDEDIEPDFELRAMQFEIREKEKGEYNRAKEKQELEKLTRDIVER